MKKIASTPDFGTLDWVKTNNPERMSSYYGSLEEYNKIPSKWEDFEIIHLDKDNSAAEQLSVTTVMMKASLNQNLILKI